MLEDFAVFILTHGRPDNVITEKTLRRQGYTGRIFYVIDDEDKTAAKYRKNYGDSAVQFSKDEVEATFDPCDNSGNRKTIVYARNASFGIAEEIGVKWFLQLDDDYTGFEFRIDGDHQYTTTQVKESLDEVFEKLLQFYQSIPAASIAIAQGGDFIGGRGNPLAKHGRLSRKCMNSFFCCTERPFKFIGRINEDVNTYVLEGSRGRLFFTVSLMTLVQKQTQSNPGGMSETYLASGTYVKSFFTVITSPSCATIGLMGDNHMRLHHSINWRKAVPKIVSEGWKK